MDVCSEYFWKWVSGRCNRAANLILLPEKPAARKALHTQFLSRAFRPVFAYYGRIDESTVGSVVRATPAHAAAERTAFACAGLGSTTSAPRL